jgi:hypothetical protein
VYSDGIQWVKDVAVKLNGGAAAPTMSHGGSPTKIVADGGQLSACMEEIPGLGRG